MKNVIAFMRWAATPGYDMPRARTMVILWAMASLVEVIVLGTAFLAVVPWTPLFVAVDALILAIDLWMLRGAIRGLRLAKERRRFLALVQPILDEWERWES